MFLIILLYLCLASTFTIGKYALLYTQPIFLIAFRMVISGILLLGYYRFTEKKPLLPAYSDRMLFVELALFHIYFSFVLEFIALQYVSSAKTNIIYSATPFISAALSYVLLSERLSMQKGLAIICGIIGLAPILTLQLEPNQASLLRISFPELLLLCATTSGAYAWFLVKRAIGRGYSFLYINGISMFIGGTLAYVTSLISEVVIPYMNNRSQPLVTEFWPFLFSTGALIIIANFLVYNLYAWLLRFYSITFLTFAGFLCPLFGAFFGWFFLNEQISWYYYLSCIIIGFALYLFYQDELRQKRTAE